MRYGQYSRNDPLEIWRVDGPYLYLEQYDTKNTSRCEPEATVLILSAGTAGRTSACANSLRHQYMCMANDFAWDLLFGLGQWPILMMSLTMSQRT
jgi:hypothetical protein